MVDLLLEEFKEIQAASKQDVIIVVNKFVKKSQVEVKVRVRLKIMVAFSSSYNLFCFIN